MIKLADENAAAKEGSADDYDYNVKGSGSGKYSTTRPEREVTESIIEMGTTTSGM